MYWSVNTFRYNANPEGFHHIADKDIEVYKFGDVFEDDGNFHPYNQFFSYKPNVLNKEIKLNLEENKNIFFARFEYEIYEGYHSYLHCKQGIHLSNHHIGKFIIPKGTEYYENEDGQIVSSNIIWTGEYEDKRFNKYID